MLIDGHPPQQETHRIRDAIVSDSTLDGMASHSAYGAMAGVVAGIAYRVWMEIPSDFKIDPTMVATPFKIPLFNIVNDVMLTVLKGPLKYAILAVPVTVAVLNICATTGARTSFKNRVKHHAPILAKAIAPFAFAILMTSTQTHWLPIVGRLVSVGANPAGTALIATALAVSQAQCNLAAKNVCSVKMKRLLNAAALVVGLGNTIFMFNTMTTYHTVREVVSAIALKVVGLEVCRYLWKGLPRLSELADLTNGASIMATAMGYDTRAFNAIVMTPLCIALGKEIPGMVKKAFAPCKETRRLYQVIEKISAIALPCMIGHICTGALLGVITTAPQAIVSTVTALNTVTTHASTLYRLGGILQVRSLLRSKTAQDGAHHALTVAKTLSAIEATIMGTTTLGGALWIAHVGFGLMVERTPPLGVVTRTTSTHPCKDDLERGEFRVMVMDDVDDDGQ